MTTIRIRTILPCMLLFLVGCGGDKASSGGADPADAPESQATDEQDAPVELTDKLMEQYVEMLQEAKKASNAGSMAFLARYGWSLQRWSSVAAAVGAGMASAGKARFGEAVGQASAGFEAQIKESEARMATASDEEKALLREQIEAARTAMRELGAGAEGITDLDRRNNEVLERWLPRLQEIQGGK